MMTSEEHVAFFREGSRMRGRGLRRHLEAGVLWSDLEPVVGWLHIWRRRAVDYFMTAPRRYEFMQTLPGDETWKMSFLVGMGTEKGREK